MTAALVVVEFVADLPAPARNPRPSSEEFRDFANQLTARPGEWAKYPWSQQYSRRTRIARCSDINHHRPGAPRALQHGFQAAFRDDTMYIRYIGGQP